VTVLLCGLGYVEEAGCFAKAKELPNYANGVKHVHIMSNNHDLNKKCGTLNNF
jgi:hypothetical protein